MDIALTRVSSLSSTDHLAEAGRMGGGQATGVSTLSRVGLEMRSKSVETGQSTARPVEKAQRPNQRWSMDFVTERLENGRYFRVLTVVDQYTRESPALEPAHSFDGGQGGDVLEEIAAQRGYPESITVDNGTEFSSRIMDGWAYKRGVKLDFIRPGKPVDNGYIESFKRTTP